MEWLEGFWYGVARRLLAWRGSKAVVMACLIGCRHGVACRICVGMAWYTVP